MADSIEKLCEDLRGHIGTTKLDVAALLDCSEFSEDDQCLAVGNIPASRHGNMAANVTLAFRHLEDARMRLGKVMQASQGGISILDK